MHPIEALARIFVTSKTLDGQNTEIIMIRRRDNYFFTHDEFRYCFWVRSYIAVDVDKDIWTIPDKEICDKMRAKVSQEGVPFFGKVLKVAVASNTGKFDSCP